MVAEGVIPPSIFNFFDDKSHHVIVILQLASRNRKLDRVKPTLIKFV